MTKPATLSFESEIFTSLSVDLADVELLQNAFIVQSLVSPLVRFSNRGRYEPYLARSWSQHGLSWTFELHQGLTCEDGQPITATAARHSLLRSLRRFSIPDLRETPFAQLEGFDEFSRTKDAERLGLVADERRLTLTFLKPVGKALLEYLAMTPFAFNCDANFDGDRWRSKDRFLSSGPYRLHAFAHGGTAATLILRPDWSLAPRDAIKTVYLGNGSRRPDADARVIMSYGVEKTTTSDGSRVLEVPRALLSVRLGVEPGRHFAVRANRHALQHVLVNVLGQTKIPFENYHRAESFFFGQMTGHETPPPEGAHGEAPTQPLKIRARAKGTSAEADFYQGLLYQALDKLGWRYEVLPAQMSTAETYQRREYDLAFDRSHVDATLDPDIVRLLFKSSLGPLYQDPGGRINHLIDRYDQGQLNYREFLIGFNAAIAEEAAILPLFHRGFVWQFSPNLDSRAVSPLMSIVHFEELEVTNEGT